MPHSTAATTRLQEYAEAISSGVRAPGCATGLYGRIIRGKKPADFEALTHDADRLIVLLLGEDGLENLVGLTGRQMLVDIIRYTDQHITDLLASGHEFKLVVFPTSTTANVKQATWPNTVDFASGVYPLVETKLRAQLAALQSTPYADIEAAAGYKFYDAYMAGDKDSRYMTYERLQASEGNLVQVRAFLFHTLHLRELFEGTGFTAAQQEHFVLNAKLQDIVPHLLLPLDMTVPYKQH
ncbi:MAG: hypothetical protein K2W95_33705 [Candidatus Obscuribacterales bacterium]|nr:hypothetical protein [Candidatus Obscuribacterales bacterium]